MCAQYLIKNSLQDLARFFKIPVPEHIEGWPEHVFPGYSAPVVMRSDKGADLCLASMNFGLEKLVSLKSRDGSWTKKERRFHNARGETIASKKSFKDHFREQRCLVPLNSFYEFRGPKGKKERFMLGSSEHPLLVAAGIWSEWPASGQRSFSIVTTAAPETVIAAGHDRCPLFLDEEDQSLWAGSGVLESDLYSQFLEKNQKRKIVEE